MNLVKEIYKSINLEKIDFTALHSMEKEAYALAKLYKEKDKNKKKDLEQLFIEASTYGHEAGFELGFRYAVKLLSECYN